MGIVATIQELLIMALREDGEERGETAPAAPEIKPTQFIVPACLIGIKYFKVDLTVYLWELRYAFAAVVCAKFLTMFLLYTKAAANTDASPVNITEKGYDGKEVTKTQTVGEYDKAQVLKSIQQAVFALCLTCGIHYKWGNPTPLLFQCIMTPVGLYDDNMFKIYVLAEKPQGKLARPFKPPPNPFAELTGGNSEKKPAGEAKDVVTAPPQKSKKSKKAD